MKATKIFMMAALALTFAACSNDDNDFAQQPAAQPANGEITITATVSSGDATTRALSPDGSNIASTWETTDKFAILYNDGTSDVKREATVSSINGSTVTITFTIPTSLASNTPCTIVYPASAANATNTGADVATALATQDGTIGNCPEVRVGTATIDKDNHSLSSVTKLTAQNAIFKFTLQDLSAGAKSATEFKVSDNSGNVITTVTPASASGELYVALPVMAAGTYWFNATIDSKPYIAKATTAAATVAGKYYQTTVKMATIGDVILDDGKFAARLSTTGTKVAMIAYLGSETGEAAPYNHGLALALSDANSGSTCKWKTSNTDAGHTKQTSSTFTEESGLQYNDATHNSDTYPAFKAAIANNDIAAPTSCSSWFLASGYQWTKMIDACKNVLGTQNNYLDLRNGFSGISGASNLQSSDYWSSTENDSNRAWYYHFNGSGNWLSVNKSLNAPRVRACLAF